MARYTESGQVAAQHLNEYGDPYRESRRVNFAAFGDRWQTTIGTDSREGEFQTEVVTGSCAVELSDGRRQRSSHTA